MDDAPALHCKLCNGEMQDGFVADKGDMEDARYSEWYPHPAVKGWLGGIKRPHTALKVRTFRCMSCGYLMSFAL